jgi:hypothetical protein
LFLLALALVVLAILGLDGLFLEVADLFDQRKQLILGEEVPVD